MFYTDRMNTTIISTITFPILLFWGITLLIITISGWFTLSLRRQHVRKKRADRACFYCHSEDVLREHLKKRVTPDPVYPDEAAWYTRLIIFLRYYITPWEYKCETRTTCLNPACGKKYVEKPLHVSHLGFVRRITHPKEFMKSGQKPLPPDFALSLREKRRLLKEQEQEKVKGEKPTRVVSALV
jgi:hypothetical protein